MGTNECSQSASKSSWESQDFGDANMVLKMAHFHKSSRPQWVNIEVCHIESIHHYTLFSGLIQIRSVMAKLIVSCWYLPLAFRRDDDVFNGLHFPFRFRKCHNYSTIFFKIYILWLKESIYENIHNAMLIFY